MRDLTDNLALIEAALQRLGQAVLLELLLPGIDRHVLDEVIARPHLAAVPELADLYEWRNGTRVPHGTKLEDIEFFPGFYLLSVQDAVANYDALASGPRWEDGWLPVFANGGGDFYVSDCSMNGAIRHFRFEESEHPVEFSSLGAMVNTLVEAFDQGVIDVGTDGHLDMDFRVFYDLAETHNPDVESWRRK